ncbi:MAG TPA: DUF4340 domain-containing protein, partial [Puia sp.]
MTTLNKRLSLVLVGLLLIYVLIRLFLSPDRESNTQPLAFHVDTTGVTGIALYPASERPTMIRFARSGGKWQMQAGSVHATPLPGSVEAMLGGLANINTLRLVSGKKNRWDEYKVGDTTGTHVVFYKGKDPIADYWIGPSFLRVNGKNNVYAVESYLNDMLNKPFSDWRDKSFLRLNKDGITTIGFQGAQGFVVSKKDSSWFIGGSKISTDSVQRYLGKLQYKSMNKFADDFQPSASPDRSLSISGPSQPLATVNAWKRPDGRWVLSSSQNPDSYFNLSDSAMEKEFWRAP